MGGGHRGLTESLLNPAVTPAAPCGLSRAPSLPTHLRPGPDMCLVPWTSQRVPKEENPKAAFPVHRSSGKGSGLQARAAWRVSGPQAPVALGPAPHRASGAHSPPPTTGPSGPTVPTRAPGSAPLAPRLGPKGLCSLRPGHLLPHTPASHSSLPAVDVRGQKTKSHPCESPALLRSRH